MLWYADMKWRAARGVLKRLSPHPFFMRRVWMLAFPIAIQNLLFSVLNMVDTFMIGQLGTEEVAGGPSPTTGTSYSSFSSSR